eukprot:TRINITY_DN68062_c0_g1_i1.p1 TRINITY_DN68062_c0_g1~~TRINITY_DN68062_c0_g1_i1.p1  ORF type:complete len:590 (-),score=93.86 TRINITY_DN68062_c0_g1_i1:319-2088(-)
MGEVVVQPSLCGIGSSRMSIQSSTLSVIPSSSASRGASVADVHDEVNLESPFQPIGSESGGDKMALLLDDFCKLLDEQRNVRQAEKMRWLALEARGLFLQRELANLHDTTACRQTEVSVDEAFHDDPVSIRVGNSVEPVTLNKNRIPPNSQQRDELHRSRLASTDHGVFANLIENIKSIIEKNMDEREETSNIRTPRWVQFIRSGTFDLAVGLLICLNTAVMSLQLEDSGHQLGKFVKGDCVTFEECVPVVSGMKTLWEICEHFFCFAFLMELVLRLAADGWKYLLTPANFADACVVVVSSVDTWVLSPYGSSAVTNMVVLRLVRLVKLSKALRVVRVMKACSSLRVLVSAIASSVAALAWSMTVLFVLEIIGAIFLAQMFQPVIEQNVELDPDIRTLLFDRFGTWSSAMISIFEVTMAPGGFIQYRELMQHFPIFTIFIVMYVIVVTFAIVRVITAMFLKATLSASQEDEKSSTTKCAAACRDAYIDGLDDGVDHAVNQSRLDFLFDQPSFRQLLNDFEVSQSEAQRLFCALNKGDGQVRFGEYLSVLGRMSASSNNHEIVLLSHWVECLCCRVLKIETALDSLFVSV